MTDTSTATGTGTGRTGITRRVMLAGIVLGTTMTILAMWNGVRLRVPNLPSIIGALIGALIVWVLFMAVAAVLSELTIRHHRAALAHGWRYGKRGGRAAAGWSRRTARAAATRSGPWRTRFIAALRARWGARGTDPVLFRRTAGPVSPGSDPGPASGPAPAAAPVPEAVPPSGTAPAITPPTGDPMTEIPGAAPGPRTSRRVLTIGGTVPAEWKNLVAITADFEPEDDAELLAWMASEVNGMSAYAEALTEVYETGVSAVGLDPVSLAALHDTADAAADAAQAMAHARQKFAAHYAEVREFAAAGGLLPHDGRWITGEGD